MIKNKIMKQKLMKKNNKSKMIKFKKKSKIILKKKKVKNNNKTKKIWIIRKISQKKEKMFCKMVKHFC